MTEVQRAQFAADADAQVKRIHETEEIIVEHVAAHAHAIEQEHKLDSINRRLFDFTALAAMGVELARNAGPGGSSR